ncbi:MAG: hypothetical protein QM668_03050 [Agriterribacter sp.]
MSTAKRVIKNTGILYIRMLVTMFISLYTTRIILSALGIADFGIFNLVAGAIAMLTFLNNAMAGASQRFISYAEGAGDIGKVKKVFNVSVVLHLIIAGAVLLILEIGGFFLLQHLKIPGNRIGATQFIYQFMIVSTLFTIISVPYDALINAHENMMLVAILGIAEAFFKLGIAIYITYTSFDKLVIYGLLTAASSILLLIAKRIYCHKKYAECEVNIKKYYSKTIFKEMTGFAGWTFMGSASAVVASYGQGIVMNMFFGTVVNAAQAITNQVSGQLGAFAGMMLKALNPVIAKSEGAKDRSAMLRATMMGSKFSSLLLMFFFIPVLIETPFIFSVWLDKTPDYAIIFCRLYLIQNLIAQLYVTFGATISAVGNIRNYQLTITFTTALPLLVSYILFKMGFDAYWLYIIFILFAFVRFGSGLYYTNKYCNLSVSDFFKKVVLIVSVVFIITLGFASIPLIFLEKSWLRLLCVCIMSTIGFISALWITGLNKTEKNMILDIIKSGYYKVFQKSYIKSQKVL